jgi:hypothetical protein
VPAIHEGLSMAMLRSCRFGRSGADRLSTISFVSLT